MNDKIISCGILLLCNNNILLWHATNSSWKTWNIPKGRLEEGESYLQCAVRETFEETNIWVDENSLIELGLFEYLPKKDLYLFATYLDLDLINLKEIKCNSYVKNENGQNLFPEFDDLKFFNILSLNKYTSKNVFNTLTQALQVLIKK